jgi:hypothetical protein
VRRRADVLPGMNISEIEKAAWPNAPGESFAVNVVIQPAGDRLNSIVSTLARV